MEFERPWEGSKFVFYFPITPALSPRTRPSDWAGGVLRRAAGTGRIFDAQKAVFVCYLTVLGGEVARAFSPHSFLGPEDLRRCRRLGWRRAFGASNWLG
jgi:hypothetical protein